MSSIEAQLDSHQLYPYLKGLAETDTGILGALVCSSDGFEVTCLLPAGLSPATLSAMASSQLALSNAMSSEVGLGKCKNLVIDSDGGRLLIMQIPNSNGGLLLAAIAGADHTLGEALWACSKAAASIGHRLIGAVPESHQPLDTPALRKT